MKYEIHHTVMQSLEVQLAQGEAVYAQAGGMAWMSDGIDMTTSGKGGVFCLMAKAYIWRRCAVQARFGYKQCLSPGLPLQSDSSSPPRAAKSPLMRLLLLNRAA